MSQWDLSEQKSGHLQGMEDKEGLEVADVQTVYSGA